MTNIIKRKGLLSLIAVVVMVAMMSVACKKKVTQPMDFSVAEDVTITNPSEEPTTPETPAIPEEPVEKPTTPEKPAVPEAPVTTETLKPDSAIAINPSKWGMLQYAGLYFESVDCFTNPDGTKFRYAIKFEEQNDGQFGKSVLVKFTGYDKNGANIVKTYAGGSAKSSSAEKQTYAPYQFGLRESSDLIIYANGYLDFKPKGFANHIKLALKKK